MKRDNESLISALIRTSHPLSLAAGLLFYALGGGIAAYLGRTIVWPVYWIGQGMVTLLQLSSFFLREYFEHPGLPFQARDTSVQKRLDNGQPAAPPRVFFLQVALTALTAGAVLTVLLVTQGSLNPAAFLFVGIAFLLSFFYAVPPFRLVYSGYGELIQAILLANLFPALAFLLQAGELHRLLGMLTFPLTLLLLAASLTLSLPTYLDDLKNNHKNMLQRLGWQRGMIFQNILIALAYVVLAISVLLGLPWRLGFPGFLSLPVALLQIWQINSIANGAKPRWRLLTGLTVAMVGLTVYFLNLALWTD